jgi:signal peptidase I
MKIVFKIIFVSVIIGFGLKIFVIEAFTVPTDSMTPTLAVGQRVWLYKLPFKVQKDNIIGFERNGENFVKRIVGMPSETVFTEGGRFQVYQNKRWASDNQQAFFIIPKRGETIILDTINYTFYQPLIEKEGILVGRLFNRIFINGSETTNYTFKQNYYFVQGDNTSNSIDSRQFGLIGEKSILGIVIK